MARAIDNEKVTSYYNTQEANKGNSTEWHDWDHDNDNIVVLKDSTGWRFAAPDPGPATIHVSGWRNSTIYEYQETPTKFLKGNASGRAEKQDKKAADRAIRDSKSTKTPNTKSTTTSETDMSTESDKFWQDTLTNELSHLHDMGETVFGSYMGQSQYQPPTTIIVPDTSPDDQMNEWTTNELLLAGGAVALGFGLLYVIVHK